MTNLIVVIGQRAKYKRGKPKLSAVHLLFFKETNLYFKAENWFSEIMSGTSFLTTGFQITQVNDVYFCKKKTSICCM